MRKIWTGTEPGRHYNGININDIYSATRGNMNSECNEFHNNFNPYVEPEQGGNEALSMIVHQDADQKCNTYKIVWMTGDVQARHMNNDKSLGTYGNTSDSDWGGPRQDLDENRVKFTVVGPHAEFQAWNKYGFGSWSKKFREQEKYDGTIFKTNGNDCSGNFDNCRVSGGGFGFESFKHWRTKNWVQHLKDCCNNNNHNEHLCGDLYRKSERNKRACKLAFGEKIFIKKGNYKLPVVDDKIYSVTIKDKDDHYLSYKNYGNIIIPTGGGKESEYLGFRKSAWGNGFVFENVEGTDDHYRIWIADLLTGKKSKKRLVYTFHNPYKNNKDYTVKQNKRNLLHISTTTRYINGKSPDEMRDISGGFIIGDKFVFETKSDDPTLFKIRIENKYIFAYTNGAFNFGLQTGMDFYLHYGTYGDLEGENPATDGNELRPQLLYVAPNEEDGPWFRLNDMEDVFIRKMDKDHDLSLTPMKDSSDDVDVKDDIMSAYLCCYESLIRKFRTKDIELPKEETKSTEAGVMMMNKFEGNIFRKSTIEHFNKIKDSIKVPDDVCKGAYDDSDMYRKTFVDCIDINPTGCVPAKKKWEYFSKIEPNFSEDFLSTFVIRFKGDLSTFPLFDEIFEPMTLSEDTGAHNILINPNKSIDTDHPIIIDETGAITFSYIDTYRRNEGIKIPSMLKKVDTPPATPYPNRVKKFKSICSLTTLDTKNYDITTRMRCLMSPGNEVRAFLKYNIHSNRSEANVSIKIVPQKMEHLPLYIRLANKENPEYKGLKVRLYNNGILGMQLNSEYNGNGWVYSTKCIVQNADSEHIEFTIEDILKEPTKIRPSKNFKFFFQYNPDGNSVKIRINVFKTDSFIKWAMLPNNMNNAYKCYERYCSANRNSNKPNDYTDEACKCQDTEEALSVEFNTKMLKQNNMLGNMAAKASCFNDECKKFTNKNTGSYIATWNSNKRSKDPSIACPSNISICSANYSASALSQGDSQIRQYCNNQMGAGSGGGKGGNSNTTTTGDKADDSLSKSKKKMKDIEDAVKKDMGIKPKPPKSNRTLIITISITALVILLAAVALFAL